MARIPLRFLLIVLLCIEVILWSRSQQAGVDLQRTSLSTIGFWKRAVAGEPFEDAVKGKVSTTLVETLRNLLLT